MKIKLPNPLKWSWKKRIVGLVVIAVIVGGGGYWYKQRSESTNSQVTTVEVQKGNLTKTLSLSGTVEASNLISVFTKASGVVSKVYVTDGQEVKAGDKLAEVTLDSEGKNNQASAWASYLSAKKGVGSAQASEYSNQASMFQSWDTYMKKTEDDNYEDPNSSYRDLPEFQILQKQWLAAEENYKTQEIGLSSAQASLSQAWYNYELYQATVTAPISGTVVGLNLAEGLTISPSLSTSGNATSQTVATIKTGGPTVVSFTATEVDINQIKVGQEARVSFDSYEGEEQVGRIVSVDRVGSVSNGVTQYTVLVSLENPPENILTNMAASATLVLAQKDSVLIVPAEAVVSGRNGKKVVRVMRNGQVQPVEVEVGLETDDGVEIVSGLSEGDVVVNSSSPASSSSSNRTEMGGPPGGGMGMVMGTRVGGGGR